MGSVFKRKSALNDLVEHYAYLSEEADDATADRFLENAEATFQNLAAQPSMGAPVASRRPELKGLRRWRVREFDRLLIFYFPRPEGVMILRVLHAHRDWWHAVGVAPAP